jgi:hypothetical protein
MRVPTLNRRVRADWHKTPCYRCLLQVMRFAEALGYILSRRALFCYLL